MTGDVRLERKLVQDRLAESVDGLDLQPARRLQRLGEQPPRAAQLFVGARLPPAFDLLRPARSSSSIVQSARSFEDALRHVGGGGPRIGQAQDLRRVGSPKQQTDDTPRQHMRLAGPGIGRHPDRVPGRRRSPAAAPSRREPGVSGRSFGFALRVVIAAGRPFEHARQMIVIAIHLAFAERQGARQIAVPRILVVLQQLFQPPPRVTRKALPRCASPCGASRIDSSSTSPWRLAAGHRQAGPASAARPRRERAAHQQSASSASCGASSVCACALDGDEPVL